VLSVDGLSRTAQVQVLVGARRDRHRHRLQLGRDEAHLGAVIAVHGWIACDRAERVRIHSEVSFVVGMAAAHGRGGARHSCEQG
jgi:hypothetical protein